jgi:fructokinase
MMNGPQVQHPLHNRVWAVAQELSNQLGFTLDLNRMRRAADEGFCVAFAATQNQFGPQGLDFVLAHAQGPNGKGIVGGWFNQGQYYFDSVSIYTTRVAAVEAAKVNGQIGIYNLRTGHYEPIMEGESFNPSLGALRKRAHSI